MKKIFFIIFIVLCIIPSYTYASWACLIKDKSAQALLDYVKNNRAIIKNISKWTNNNNNNELSKSNNNWFIEDTKDSINKWYSNVKRKSIEIFNDMFRYEWFYSYFRYFAYYPITREVPFEVKRDYQILDNEYNSLKDYVIKIDSMNNADEIITDACSWVDKNCNLDNKPVKEILAELIKNNDKVLDLFRLTVMWEQQDFNEELLLVDNNFKLEIEKNYWMDAISDCNADTWWFFDTIKKSIDDIKLLNQQWEEWIQAWRDAWDLMLWTEPDTEAIYERELLKNNLSDQWISMENQNILIDNLTEYNLWWLSINNNFITNTIWSTFAKIDNKISTWKQSFAWKYFDSLGKQSIVYNDINTASENSKTNIELKERVANLYNKELPYASISDINTETIRAKIIESHISLDDSINILENTIKLSQKVCNSQNKWAWKCN